MLANGFTHGVDLVDRFLNRFRPHDLAGNPDGKENGCETTLAHAGDVDVAVCVAGGEIKPGVEEALRGVIMSIDDDRGRLEPFGFLGNGIAGRSNNHQENSQETHRKNGEQTNHQAPGKKMSAVLE
jgi:hypothetical protein